MNEQEIRGMVADVKEGTLSRRSFMQKMAAVGIAGGLAVAFGLTRQVQAQLFGLAPTDPATLAGAAALLAVIALAAGYFPARRATTIDPLVSLRTD